MPRRNKWFKGEGKESLMKFGYSPKKALSTRRRSLRKAINSHKHSAFDIFTKLNRLANVTHDSQKSNSKIYRKDANWVNNNYL